MKKLVITTIVSLLLAPQVLAVDPGDLESFSDVPVDHPNYNAILTLRYDEIIEGYEDNTFRPENTINRVEALKLAFEVAEMEMIQGIAPATFSDIEEMAWYTRYLNRAVYEEIVQGYPDGSFKPGQNVNLVEFLKMLLLAQDVDVESANYPGIPYADVMPKQWYSKYVEFAKIHNLIDPDEENRIFPDHFITRAEAAEIIYRFKNIDWAATDEEIETLVIPEEKDPVTYDPQNEYALFVSDSFKFAIEYPKFWFYAASDSEDESIFRVYEFGPDDLTENPAYVRLDLLPLATEITENLTFDQIRLEKIETEDEIVFLRKIADNRVYKISGALDEEQNILFMITSITPEIDNLESYNPEEAPAEDPLAETENNTEEPLVVE